jgi:uncharacterized protein YndB with AHSA1/START domain
MLKKIVLALSAFIVGFSIFVYLQPGEFKVSRAILIAAPAAQVFEQVNDFHHWTAWSPWAKLDPAMTTHFEGAPFGRGAVYGWKGNDKVGEGKMTLLQSDPASMIRIQIDFESPMKATHLTEFSFKADSQGTLVNWSMFGKNNFISKAFHLFIDMDKMIGADFEKGLAQLKMVSEAAKK